MSLYRVATPAFGLSVEKDTPSVPEDGRYHVLLNDEIVASTRTEREALRIYREKRAALLAAGRSLPVPEQTDTKE